MKKTILILTALLIASTVFSQKKFATDDEVKKFFESETYFLKEDNIMGVWNMAITNAANRFWKISKVNFATPAQFETAKDDPQKSFITESLTYFNGRKNLGVFKSLSLVLGEKGKTLITMPALGDFIIAYNDTDYEKYYYKLGLGLMFLQNQMEWRKENKGLNDNKIINHYRKAALPTKNKTLYLLKEELAKNVNTLSKIKKYYSGKVVFSTPDEMEDLIRNHDKNALILHVVRPTRTVKGLVVIKSILSAENGEIYYFNYHRIKKRKRPRFFLAKDFKLIEKQ